MPTLTSRTRILLAGELALPIADTPSLLSLHNPEFLTTSDGKEAFLLMARHHPRLVIVNQELTGMSGEDLVSLVRADRELRHTSLILIRKRLDPDEPKVSANAVFDCGQGLDVEALIERADRLLCIQPRVPARASVCLGRRLPDRTSGSFAESINLSESGILLSCREDLGLGEDVWLHFVLPEMLDLIAARGRVVRAAHEEHRLRTFPASGMQRSRSFGLEFTNLLPDDQLKIRGFVSHYAQAA